MPRLPFLVGIFSVRGGEEIAITGGRIHLVSQMVQTGGAQEERTWIIRQKLYTVIQGFERESVMLIYGRGNGYVAVGVGQPGIQLGRLDQFLLSLVEFS